MTKPLSLSKFSFFHFILFYFCQNSSKYRREAINLLSEALGTPTRPRKNNKREDISDRSSDVSDDFTSCGEGSTTSLGGTEHSTSTENDSSTASSGRDKDKERKVRKLPQLHNATGEAITDRTSRASSEERTDVTGTSERLNDQNVRSNIPTGEMDTNHTVTGKDALPLRSHTNPTVHDIKHQGSDRKLSMDPNVIAGANPPPPLPPRSNTVGSMDLESLGKKECHRSPVERRKASIPTAKPISARPSKILQQMLDAEENEKARLKEEKERQKQQEIKDAEEKRLREQKEAEEKEREEKLKEEKERKEREEERKRLEEEQLAEEGDHITSMKNSKSAPATTPKKTLPVMA